MNEAWRMTDNRWWMTNKDNGWRTTDNRWKSMDNGWRTTDHGQQTRGEQIMDGRQWMMNDRKWMMDGKWWTMDGKWQTMAKNNGWQVADNQVSPPTALPSHFSHEMQVPCWLMMDSVFLFFLSFFLFSIFQYIMLLCSFLTFTLVSYLCRFSICKPSWNPYTYAGWQVLKGKSQGSAQDDPWFTMLITTAFCIWDWNPNLTKSCLLWSVLLSPPQIPAGLKGFLGIPEDSSGFLRTTL